MVAKAPESAGVRGRRKAPRFAASLAVLAALPCARAADADAPPAVAFHGQATEIHQGRSAFAAPYTGPNSLVPQAEKSWSRTVTIDLGIRPWAGAQFHLDAEAAAGMPFSHLTGSGGIANGELQRGASTRMRAYAARWYVQQRIALGGAEERIDPGFNELGEVTTARRWTLVAGTFSLLDFADPNPWAKDPRSQFTNWSFLTHGAWDYPADARGYTLGALAEYRSPGWAVRFGRAAQPLVSNGLALDRNLARQWGEFVEAESDLPWQAPGGPLRARVLAFRNRVDAGRFADAIALAASDGTLPRVDRVRRLQHKTGWGLTLEAPLADGAGVFLRASASDGRTETYAFAEIDRQLALGAQFTGAAWGREQDRWGVGAAVNGLSGPHRDYLAAGGLGAFLGDGRLAYAAERVLEGWYRWTLPDVGSGATALRSAVSAGLQVLANPGDNADRHGPVRLWTVRLHAEF